MNNPPPRAIGQAVRRNLLQDFNLAEERAAAARAAQQLRDARAAARAAAAAAAAAGVQAPSRAARDLTPAMDSQSGKGSSVSFQNTSSLSLLPSIQPKRTLANAPGIDTPN